MHQMHAGEGDEAWAEMEIRTDRVLLNGMGAELSAPEG
jgi:hypothetical protein